MFIVILTIATLLIAGWLLLLARVNNDDIRQAVQSGIFDNRCAQRKLKSKENIRQEKHSHYSGFVLKCVNMLSGMKRYKRKAEKLDAQTGQLRSGNTSSLNILIMPGYVLQREITAIGKSELHKTILSKCFELYGKKHAEHKSCQLLAKILSYPVAGIAFTLMLGVILSALGSSTAGLGVISAGTALVLVMTYALYDELCDSVNNRRAAIIRQFPNVVSKLALLVTSGIIMDRAWKETAQSQDAELYIEMRKTSKELDNLVSPELAYSGFITRCNTKETAKLASAIMQNLSKGNAEIGRLLKDMAHEVWLERRHTAKRDAEKANSKLMIPTMLLFLAILVMLMVPIAMNFTGI